MGEDVEDETLLGLRLIDEQGEAFWCTAEVQGIEPLDWADFDVAQPFEARPTLAEFADEETETLQLRSARSRRRCCSRRR
jgi:hypothetical protein